MKKNLSEPILKNPEQIKWLIGIDEVGRGPLAGPVGLALCAIPYHGTVKDSYKQTLNIIKKELKKAGLKYIKGKDSKKMTAGEREKWHGFLNTDTGHIKCLYTSKSADEIDRKGISDCIKSCITSLLDKHCKTTGVKPENCLVLLDGGLKAPLKYINQETYIKGDEKEMVISFASIFAKVTRDEYMKNISKISKEFALYNFNIHKGYGTKAHINVIIKNGMSSLHRKSFCTRISARTVSLSKALVTESVRETKEKQPTNRK